MLLLIQPTGMLMPPFIKPTGMLAPVSYFRLQLYADARSRRN